MLKLLPPLIILCGIILLFKLKFFFILHPVRNLRALKSSFKSASAIKALMLSLAGTLGVGNIVGVAFGISVGGAGSVFWLIFSALFSMVIKYSEVVISSNNTHGMIDVVKASLSPWAAVVYSVLCLLLSLSMGSALQARSAVESLGLNGIFLIIAAIIFTALTAFAINGGGKKIEALTAYIIPIASIVYTVLCLTVIIKRSDALPSLLRNIFTSAFTPAAALGGGGGFMINTAMREGFSRGLLSNEAGAGTSTLAHARNRGASPHAAGMLGLVEVFIDTVILCTLTAITVLCAVPEPEMYTSGVEIIGAAIATLGTVGKPLLAFSMISFAYSTVICWYYYGSIACKLLFKKRHGWYPFIFLISVFAGSLTASPRLIVFSDHLLFLLSLISLLALIKNLDRIESLSRLDIKEV